MTAPTDWPAAQSLSSADLILEPLQVEHAEEMAPLLDDARLHIYIGGEPASLGRLRDRYRRQVVGRSADGSQLWFNWVLSAARRHPRLSRRDRRERSVRGRGRSPLRWEISYNAEEYLRLLDTFSGHIAMEVWQRDRLYAEIRRRLAQRSDRSPASSLGSGPARRPPSRPNARFVSGSAYGHRFNEENQFTRLLRRRCWSNRL